MTGLFVLGVTGARGEEEFQPASTVDEVRQITNDAALSVTITGRGRAVHQDPPPGTVVAVRAQSVRIRFENTDVDDTDPLLFDQGLDFDASILGIRWDFNPYAALKAEYRNEEFDNGGRENNFRVQLSFVLAKL